MSSYAQIDDAIPHPHSAPEEAVIDTHIRHLRGARNILETEELLREFAATTGQQTGMHGLQYRLEHEFARRKSPHLLCVVKGSDAGAALTVGSLVGVVLLFEYRFAGRDTGFFATGDSGGMGTVLALPQARARVAAQAGFAALRAGRMVLVCFRSESGPLPEFRFAPQQSGLWAAQMRDVRDRLILASSYEGTLGSLGRRTRTHLRYYRRRLAGATGCTFVADVALHISQKEVAALNEASLEPVRQRIMDLRFHTSSTLAGGFVHGLRAADGRWLCLAGGWRQGRTSILEWQVNSAKFRKLSLSTAFRGFLIEHEVSLGTAELYFHGGTSHSISHAFEQSHAVDLLLRRPGPLTSTFADWMRNFAEKDTALANRGNFLIDALRSRNLEWQPIADQTCAVEF